MSAGRKKAKCIDIGQSQDDNTGIEAGFRTTYLYLPTSDDSDTDVYADLVLAGKRDPVRRHNRGRPPNELEPTCSKKEPKCPRTRSPPVRSDAITPSLSTRCALGLTETIISKFPEPYIPPRPRGWDKMMAKKNKEECRDKALEICDYEVVRLPSPILVDSLRHKFEVKSPEVSKYSVKPEYPSYITNSGTFVPPPTPSELKERELSSGIFINVIDKQESFEDSEEKMIPPKGKTKRKRAKSIKEEEVTEPYNIEEYLNAINNYYVQDEGGVGSVPIEKIDHSTHVSDDLVLGKMGEIISQTSLATSMAEREKSFYEEMSWCEIPAVSKLVQTLRDSQRPKPKLKYKKGALENHSFTKIKQKTDEDFCYKCVSGTIHQGDLNFLPMSRNRQGICMPAVAFCYASLYKPKTWKSRCIDEVVEIGNILYMDSIAELHMHRNKKEITVDEMQKFVVIHTKKIKFEILEPEVKGLVRSKDKKITNLTCGLKMFFLKYSACILRAEEVNILIMRSKKKRYYVFDATARKNNLYQDPNGTATLAYVHGLRAIVSILLDRTEINNSPFNLRRIQIVEIMGKDENEEEKYVSEQNTFKMVNERQAIVQASFDLGDLCFAFSRNKQALPMTLVALAYSRITPPNSWHKKTLDKIMIIGNQLYGLCTESEKCSEVTLEHLPSVFTLGPYVLEVQIYQNVAADCMWKKGKNMFLGALRLFFERNSNGIAQIGKSYLAFWQQRGMYYTFDPYTRNKEGLKCRTGVACVTMNKDVDTMVETIMLNFEYPETIFYLHALKLLRIQRDQKLSKLFPRHLTLRDIPVEVFKKHRIMKSKRKAVDKPLTADFAQKALRKFLVCEDMEDSVIEVPSVTESVGSYMFALDEKFNKPVPKALTRTPDDEEIVDLDSPSLSDTQIAPKRPVPYEDELIPMDDLASYELTEEEKEMMVTPEGEGKVIIGVKHGAEEAETRTTSISKFGVAWTEAHSDELDPCYRGQIINTDLTYCYKLLPAKELPQVLPHERELQIDDDEQEEQFQKLRNFEEVNENIQILRARTNAVVVTETADINLVCPYMCILATAFAQEVPIYKWDRRTIDYVLKAGLEVYYEHQESFLHIDDFKFELDHSSWIATIDVIFNTFIGDGLFDSFSGQMVLENFLENHIFKKQDCGFVIMPFYACAVFFKRGLFYLLDPFNCDKKGEVIGGDGDEEEGHACLLRFKNFDTFVGHLIGNLSTRVMANDKSELNFRMLTLAKPIFTRLDKPEEPTKEEEEEEKIDELKRRHNFIDLPDGSQLVRGRLKLADFGDNEEMIAPYICTMAAALSSKYAMRTWNSDIIDFLMNAGHQLYKKSRFQFYQLSHLDIPRVSLGKTDFRIEVRYVFDSPMRENILSLALKKVLTRESEWALIVTEVYSCAAFQSRGLCYLFDPFACNDLGLEDGPSGTCSLARFKTHHDLCSRILFNKGKREKPDKVEHIRFILYIVKACIIPKPPPKKKPKSAYASRYLDEAEGEGEFEEEGGAEEEGEEEVGEEEVEEEPKNKIGYQDKGKYQVLEGTKVLTQPEQGQTDLGEDHFVTLVACLTVIDKPLAKWDTKTVDRVIGIGKNIYEHADDLGISRKRTIRNVLIGKHFFDVNIRIVTIANYKKNRNFETGLNTVMHKRRFIIVQFTTGTYVVYLDKETSEAHLFNPYKFTFKKHPKDEDEEETEVKAGWIKFANLKQLRRFLRTKVDLRCYNFYTFDVINVTRAPKSMVIGAKIQEYRVNKEETEDLYGKVFHERQSWLDVHKNPWARLGEDPLETCDKPKWFNWATEYPNDLYSLVGTIHQTSKEFKSISRGKQGLAVAVASIGMTGIYELKEWNSQVVDAIVRCGNDYFLKCIENIEDENYEIRMEDLLQDCEIFPYKFQIYYGAVVEGTMFLKHSKKFNLYKALRFFFDDFSSRAGVIWSTRNKIKRVVAIAKLRDSEYYMFDSQAWGPPMFAERRGFTYVLRCTTLARLVHVLVLTLRGGEFYIYEVIADKFVPISEDEKKDRKKQAEAKEEKKEKKEKKRKAEEEKKKKN